MIKYPGLLAITCGILIMMISCNKDNCEGHMCMNDGVCVDGWCDCADGYEGFECEDQKTPRKMFITDVLVTRFPALDNGSGWDLQDGPDIFIQFGKGGDLLYEASAFYENADPNEEFSFSAISIEIEDATDSHIIQVMDYDHGQSDDDWMGGIEFTPYFSNTNGFPTTLELDAGGTVAFTLTLNYVW